jgi:hypothetical protein
MPMKNRRVVSVPCTVSPVIALPAYDFHAGLILLYQNATNIMNDGKVERTSS